MGTRLAFALGLLACVAYGCGDDDDDAVSRCPADAGAGTHVSCHCGDAGTGTATCKSDGTMGACSCASDGGSAGGGSGGHSGNGGTGAAGAGSGGSGGSAGSAGTNAENDDAGVDEDAGTGTSEEPAPSVPTDGTQFTACNKDRDCNRNFGCYNPEGGGFCSAVCSDEQDCADLKGGTFHCGASGVCSLACTSADDTSCPMGMKCQPAAGSGGELRCLYPVPTPEPQGTPFAACMSGGGGGGGNSCMDGLECVGGNGGNRGFCSHSCTPQDSDCTDVTAPSGTIAATCVPQTPELGNCALNCEAMPAGCPEGMQCVQQGFYMLCRYPMN